MLATYRARSLLGPVPKLLYSIWGVGRFTIHEEVTKETDNCNSNSNNITSNSNNNNNCNHNNTNNSNGNRNSNSNNTLRAPEASACQRARSREEVQGRGVMSKSPALGFIGLRDLGFRV